ncbi:hydrogenase maturation nickel metallochaperone HypA [Conexibacter sp. CPCC 206217]|uniref:hydrogenase maturation nickel metallochaperone HypA/HybF n=1 Tax=Conexibacter sp. CPCC 206217 TaxID=3064574 RepID=UPI0027217EF1|nr:hydrogenase maturation nickel metallochaperone HypA [Conexibacter sp. CPCC 206217]MDO8210310.1 hydrogenase maturation nickel metallochaperone HypA [Conexibacter sp. CPCC 206217]
MHELSIGAAVVDTAVRHAAGRRVRNVHLRVGALRQVVPGSLAFYFGLVARETVCEGATLEQELVGARLRCLACAREWAADALAFRCPSCGGAAVAVLSGEELEVESIEVETKTEASCIA